MEKENSSGMKDYDIQNMINYDRKYFKDVTAKYLGL